MLSSPRNLRTGQTNSCVRCVRANAYAKAEPGKTQLGFVGIGIMGLPMAKNLISAGYDLTVWNRSSDKLAPLAELGAKIAETPAQVASQTDYTFAMLADNEAAREVALGPGGIAEGIRGKGYVDMSTLSEATAVDLAYEVGEAGGTYLEAPVSGSKGPAEQGALIFLTAGDEELYEAVAAPLDVMGKARLFLGDPGAGARMKLVVNMVMGSMMASLSEGLLLAERSGLQPAEVVDVLGLGAMACPMFALKGPAMVEGKYPTAFPYKHQLKDLKYALEMAEDGGVTLSVASAVTALYDGDAEAHSEKDFSAVLEAVRAAQS